MKIEKKNIGFVKKASLVARLIRVSSHFVTFTIIFYVTATLIFLSGLDLLNIFVLISWIYLTGQTISDLKNAGRHVDDKFRKEI